MRFGWLQPSELPLCLPSLVNACEAHPMKNGILPTTSLMLVLLSNASLSAQEAEIDSSAGTPQAEITGQSEPANGVAENSPAEGVLPGGSTDPAGPIADQQAPTSLLAEFFGNPLNLLLISGILFVFIVLRPQQRQMKELQQAMAGLKKNDRVITGSGIHGTVVQASSDEAVVTLRIDDNSGARMTVNRDAITKIVTSDSKE